MAFAARKSTRKRRESVYSLSRPQLERRVGLFRRRSSRTACRNSCQSAASKLFESPMGHFPATAARPLILESLPYKISLSALMPDMASRTLHESPPDILFPTACWIVAFRSPSFKNTIVHWGPGLQFIWGAVASGGPPGRHNCKSASIAAHRKRQSENTCESAGI